MRQTNSRSKDSSNKTTSTVKVSSRKLSTNKSDILETMKQHPEWHELNTIFSKYYRHLQLEPYTKIHQSNRPNDVEYAVPQILTLVNGTVYIIKFEYKGERYALQMFYDLPANVNKKLKGIFLIREKDERSGITTGVVMIGMRTVPYSEKIKKVLLYRNFFHLLNEDRSVLLKSFTLMIRRFADNVEPNDIIVKPETEEATRFPGVFKVKGKDRTLLSYVKYLKEDHQGNS